MITKKEWELIAKMISFSIATTYHSLGGLNDEKLQKALKETMMSMKHIEDAPDIDKE